MDESGEKGREGQSGEAAEAGAAGAEAARLEELRLRIREVDRGLIALVGERRDLALQIGRLKEALGLPVLDPAQEAKVVRRAAEIARELGGDEELVRDVIWRIIASARSAQEGRTHWGPPNPRGDPSGSGEDEES
jgi:chorismate mutase